MRGALMITLAGFVSRLLGAIYKPVVARIFAPFDGQHGDAGLGLVQVPAPAYLIILSVSATGLNVAISKLVAERMARGQPDRARRVFLISLALTAGLGLALTVGFFAAADALAGWAGRPETAAGFRAIAPAIFLVSVMSAFRGLFQGLQQMTAYALSQICEQMVRVLTGIVLVWWLVPRSVALGAAGYNFGAVAGALAGLVYLVWLYWQSREMLRAPALLPAGPGPVLALGAAATGSAAAAGTAPAAPGAPDNTGAIVRQILVLAAPICLIGAGQSLIQFADSMLVINRLAVAGVLAEQADKLLGQLGNAFSIIWLPSMLTHALYISLVPAITESLARGNPEQAWNRSATAYRLTFLLGLPATVGLWVMPDAVYKLLFLGDGGPVLRALSLGTLPMMLQQTSSGILQGAGDIATPVRNFLFGLAAKVALTWYWTAGPLGARGAAYATVAAFSVAAGLNMWSVWRRTGILVSNPGALARTAGAAALMGVVTWWLAPVLVHAVGSVQLGALAAIVLAAALFGIALLLLGGLPARDVEMVPRIGRPLAAALRRLGLLRDRAD